MNRYRISEVAELTNLSMDTLRYYEKIGLVPTPIKNNRGYKEYTDSEVQYIKFITYLKRTEMPLSNIKEYIDFYNQKNFDECYQLLKNHASTIEEQIEERKKVLETIRYKLKNFKDLAGGEK